MKRLVSLTAVICSVFLFAGSVFAQSTGVAFPQTVSSKMMPPVPGGSFGSLLGQDHRYSVTFRGNGEAVVTARIFFTNDQNEPVSQIPLRVPRVIPSDIIAYQVIMQGPCIQYETRKLPVNGMPEPQSFPYQPNCLTYQEPDYSNWYGPAKYQKAPSQFSGDTVTVTLPAPVRPSKSGSFILYFRTAGYAKKDLAGAYNYLFETLKTEQTITSLQVGITTDSDLMLKGATGKVDYRFADAGMAIKATEAMSAPVANSRMDMYYQQIGQGEIVKTASNLQPLDSYTVQGSYADSAVKLYAKNIAAGVFIFILFAAAGYFLIRLAVRSLTSRKVQKPESAAQTTTHAVLLVFGLSMGSGVITLIYSVVLIFLSQNLSRFFGYEMQMPVTLLLLIISLGIYGFLFLIPALMTGIRYGLGYGVATAGLTIVWLVLALLIYIVIGTTGQRGMPLPYVLNSATQMAEPGYGAEGRIDSSAPQTKPIAQ